MEKVRCPCWVWRKYLVHVGYGENTLLDMQRQHLVHVGYAETIPYPCWLCGQYLVHFGMETVPLLTMGMKKISCPLLPTVSSPTKQGQGPCTS